MTYNPARWKKQRNLVQYREMSDEEFFEAMRERDARIASEKVEPISEASPTAFLYFEKKVEKKKQELANDYDLTGMKANDIEVVNALCRAYVQLEDLQTRYFYLTNADFADNFDSVKTMMELIKTLNADISKMQTDLDISRNKRNKDKDASVVSAIEELKAKAKKYYEKVMMYVYCPECRMLIATIWFLYPEKENILNMTCGREHEDDGKTVACGHKLVITSKELYDKRGTNHPEGFKF